MPQQSSTVSQFRPESHAAELRPVNIRNAIVPGEPLIQESIVRGQQIHDIAILAHNAFKEQFRLAPETLPQLVIPVGIEHSIGRSRLQIPQVQQLIGEVFHESLRPGIGKHAPHLRLKRGWIVKFPLAGKVDQFVVRNAAPQEEGQTGGQF